MLTGRSPAGDVARVLAVVAAAGAVVTAAWLIPASLHIVNWPRSGPQRIAVLAPLQHLWALSGAALVACAGAIAWGRRAPGRLEALAHTVTPATLLWAWAVPYLPWLPDRFPLLVAGAGPLRWVVAAVAVGGMLARLTTWRPRVGVSGRPRLVVFAASLAVYLGLGLTAVGSTGLGGDEPHYLVIAHSLLADGDLKIENNHSRGDYRRFFNGPLRPDFLRRGVDGEIYSIHAPGLPALLLPGYAIAGALGAIVMMCLLAALAALAIFDVAASLGGTTVGWLTWAASALTVPFVPHAWAIYPEMAGAAIVAWGLAWVARAAPATPGAWVWRGCCLAALPWLHTKFSVLLAGLALMLAWPLRRRPAALAALLTPMAVSGLAWLGFFYVVYGVLDPQAPYGAYTSQFVRMENLPRSLLGSFVDQKFGLLVYAPVFALVAPGVRAALPATPWRGMAWGALALAVAYTLSSARLYMWWGGSSAPARFLVPVVPLVTPMLALGVARVRGRPTATLWWTAGAASVLIAVGGAVGASRFLLFSEPHGVARVVSLVQGSAPLAAALPTFTEEDWLAPARLILPWLAAGAAGIGAAAWLARRHVATVWVIAAQVLGGAAIATLLRPSFGAEVRAASAWRGDLDLLDRFDPVRLRAFDYARWTRLSPQAWLDTLVASLEREPGAEVDAQGRLTEALRLPPGEYDVRVWFDGGERPRAGAVQAAVGYGHTLARTDGPLPNPTDLRVSLPIAVPSLWVQLTDLASARSVRRLELRARDVRPQSLRPPADVTVVEAVPGRPSAYVGYTGEGAFPEGGVFWTRADLSARLWLAPAGASTLTLIVHVGPTPTTVALRVGGETRTIDLDREETRVVRVPLPVGERQLPVEVRARDFFVPARVDSTSTDTRELGCQVRLVLE